MDTRQVAEHMFNAWIFGFIMLYLVKKSEFSHLLRIKRYGLWRFSKLLLFLTAMRVIWLTCIASDATIAKIKASGEMVPWQTMPMVFWEDMCHAIPLVILAKLYSDERWFKILRVPLLTLVSLSFGMGHLYQGLYAALILSLYVPFTMRLGLKYGFGTIMLCHIAYDMSTSLTFKAIFGLM